KGTDPAARSAALAVLVKVGPDAKEALPVLLEQLKQATRDAALTDQLTVALGRLGPPAVPDLVALATGKDVPLPVQLKATHALTRGGPGAAEAVARLLDSDDPVVRGLAFRVLLQTGPAAKGAVPRLTEALDDLATREAAIEALRAI